jgi:hypothetical protein
MFAGRAVYSISYVSCIPFLHRSFVYTPLNHVFLVLESLRLRLTQGIIPLHLLLIEEHVSDIGR